MAEKNIIVDRGIPPSGNSGGAAGGNVFGGFWGGGDMSSVVGSVTVSIDGVSRPSGPSFNAAAVFNSTIVESVLSGDGWPSIEAYYDLGMSVWGILPYQILEVRDEVRDNFLRKERALPATLDAEQRAAEAAAGSNAALSPGQRLERSIGIVKAMMAKRDELIKFNRLRLSTSPGSEVLERNIDKMVAELKKLDDEQIPPAIDQVLDMLSAGLSLHGDLSANAMLQEKLDKLQAQAREVAEQEAYKSAVSFASDVGKEVASRFGTQMAKAADELKKDIAGKTVKSYDQAMQAFEKLARNPGFKMNQKDTAAIVQALNALDVATYADNAMRLGKAFGVTGKAVQATTLAQKAASGFSTGEWKPFFLELESIAVGALVGAAAGAVLGAGLALVLAPGLAAGAGIIATGVILAAVSSYIDAQAMESFNQMVLNAVAS
ncbi:colicin-like pore-forming protein [Pseudomonas rubra]|uniref:Colicin-like pore-forming protein n=1 Tax=Pseudomonas rubra TaxID=2942627 RepID=A0ABT5P938_9PSED|nr:colicin-like pore-forming protein [Pseudomonas rubra]MDD1014706.1 colicin-like pore-forming protein [Pseudomonas rubra]MDD1040845.1 colicin-like pore-forming protein [Pseudomonas rubra]MDD1157625.1 colicin-like pore-forming protein [Pseudomonas rubra]